MGVSAQMDPLDFLTKEELLFFFHRKKTEISCIEQPHRLLTQMRDHDLVPEKLYEVEKHTHFYIPSLSHPVHHTFILELNLQL